MCQIDNDPIQSRATSFSSHAMFAFISAPTNHSSGRKTLLRCLPIDNIPNSTKILRLSILILQTIHRVLISPITLTGTLPRENLHLKIAGIGKDLLVSMLPRINPQQRLELSHHRILIRIRPHTHLPGLSILHQPSPSAPLYAR